MNGTDTITDFELQKICRTCLTTNTDVYPISFEFRNFYNILVGKISNEEYNMKTCIKCSWILRKLIVFQHQCQSANNIMKEIIYMDKRSLHLIPQLNTPNLTIKTESHYIGPNIPTDSENETNNTTDLSTNELSNFFNDNNSFTSEFTNDLTIKVENDDFDNDNDDDLPLVVFKDRKTRKKKRKKDKKLTENSEVKDKNVTDNDEVKKKKEKKELREGFTSRMVQETDEYVVIKLSRDQVLQEMHERSQSEVYTRYPFKCEKCVKGFNFQDVLQTHMEKHIQENGNFQCDMCYQYCPSAVSLRGHIKSHTTRYKCKMCTHVRLSRQHLLEHHAIAHHNQPTTYKCHSCLFTTNKRTVMQRHVRSHTVCEPHACHKCGKLFKTVDSLRVHTMRHDKSSLHSCTQCAASFVYLSLLHKHVESAHSSRDLYCVECDTRFKSYESLRLHFKKAKRHRDTSLSTEPAQPQSPAACSLCARRYTNRDALRAHVWRTHRGHCARCGGETGKGSSNKITKRICICSDLTSNGNKDIEKHEQIPQNTAEV